MMPFPTSPADTTTIGELCDQFFRQAKPAQAGYTQTFLKTLVDPLLATIREHTGLDGRYEEHRRYAAHAIATFYDDERASKPLEIDYVACIGGNSLRIWAGPQDLPEGLQGHVQTSSFTVPRDWTVKDFTRLIQF